MKQEDVSAGEERREEEEEMKRDREGGEGAPKGVGEHEILYLYLRIFL